MPVLLQATLDPSDFSFVKMGRVKCMQADKDTQEFLQRVLAEIPGAAVQRQKFTLKPGDTFSSLP